MGPDYLPAFMGKIYGSKAFDKALADFQRHLRKAKIIPEKGELDSLAGEVEYLKRASTLDISSIPQGNDRDILLIATLPQSPKAIFVKELSQGNEDVKLELRNLQTSLREQGVLKRTESLEHIILMRADLLKVNGLNLNSLKPHYNQDSALLMINKGQKEGTPLYVQRITYLDLELLNRHRENPSEEKRGNFITPRYSGYDIEKGGNFEQRIYYLSISLDRFLHKCKQSFRWGDASISSNRETTNIKAIRKHIKILHDQEIKLPPPLKNLYINITRDLAKMAWLIARPTNEPNGVEVIKRAFLKNEGAAENKDKVFDNPNQIMSLALRATLMALSATINDYQRDYRIKNLPSDPASFEVNEQQIKRCTSEIDRYLTEVSLMYSKVSERTYDSRRAKEARHHINPETEASFKKMYIEIFGDLFKTVNTCAISSPYAERLQVTENATEKDAFEERKHLLVTKGYSQLVAFGNNQMFHNRILKIDECTHDIHELFATVRKCTVPREVSSLIDRLEVAAHVYVGTSAGAEGDDFSNVENIYERVDFELREHANLALRSGLSQHKDSISYFPTKSAEAVLAFCDFASEVVKSKRQDELSVRGMKRIVSVSGIEFANGR